MSRRKKTKNCTKGKSKNETPTMEDILNLKPGEGLVLPKGFFEVEVVDGNFPKRKLKLKPR